MQSNRDKRVAFKRLHERGCFVIPNPWDIGSARVLEHFGFSALASSSAGFAWAHGQTDYAVGRDAVLAHLRELNAAVDLPINADFEDGFSAEPEGVAANIALAIDAGVAGLSIEDRDVTRPATLFDLPRSVERLRAARAAIDRSGEPVILVARAEGLLHDPSAITPVIDKLVAFAAAGADCVFAPGARRKQDITAIVRAVAPTSVNVVIGWPGSTVAELADLGVRRISIGGSLAKVAWTAVFRALEQIKAGSFEPFGEMLPSQRLNDVFAPR